MTLADALGAEKADQTGRKVHGQIVAAIADKLAAQGLTPEHIGRVHKLTLTDKAYQAFHKSAEGEAVVTDLKSGGLSFSFSPSWENGPEWPVVQPARPCVVRPVKSSRSGRTGTGRELERVQIVPDSQIGYRRFEDGTLDPFHDEAAMTVCLKIMKRAQPTVVVLLGDNLDLPDWGKYTQEPSFALTSQASIDRAHRFLAEIKANAAPGARIVWIQGNHEARIPRLLIDNAKAAFALRRANTPDSWPVMSVPHLLHFDDLGVEWVPAYPSGIAYLNDNLAAIHGHTVRSKGSTTAVVVDDERVSVCFGHVHRVEASYATARVRNGVKVRGAWSFGCLCRIDGAVPGSGGIDEVGRPVTTKSPNWQQGTGIIEVEPGDGRFAVEQILIHDGRAIYRGEVFDAS